MEPNVLLVSVINARGLYLKGHAAMEALVTVTLQGKGSMRSRAMTETVHTEGDCHWDEHMEFKITDPSASLIICAQHKSRLGRNDVIGRVEIPLEKAKTIRGNHWYALRKKNNEEKYRGEVQIGFEFRFDKSNLSISNQSLNTIGHKDSMFDKLKGKIKLGKLRAHNDTDNLSIASGVSGVSAFSSVSKISKGRTLSNLFGKKKKKHDDDNASNTLSVEEPHERRSPVSSASNLQETMGQSNPPLAFQRMGSQRWRQGSTRQPPKPLVVDSVTSEKTKPKVRKVIKRFESMSEQTIKKDIYSELSNLSTANGISSLSTAESFAPQRPSSVASSGIGSNHKNQNGSDDIQENANNQDLLARIDKLEMELRVKDSRMRDMEEYLDGLLSRVMEKCPDLLASSTGAGGIGSLKGIKNRRFLSTIGF